MKREININKTARDLLKKNYEDACNAYADAFCEKHGYYKLRESYDTFWVGDETGGILTVGDEFADMATIITDINEDAPEEEFTKWNDYTTIHAEMYGYEKTKCLNFHSWLHGAPRIPYDTLNHLQTMKLRFEKAVGDAKKEGGLK